MRIRSVLLALVPGTALAITAAAQDAGGGRILRFGISENLEATRNQQLDPVSKGTTTRADTSISARLATETRNEKFNLSTSAALRGLNRPDEDPTFTFADPGLNLSYSRTGPGSQFRLGAALSSDDISFRRPITDFINEDGELELPDDLTDLEGEGTRRNISASTSVNWGQDGPVGFGLSARFGIVDYQDTTSPNLFDHRTYSVGASTKLVPSDGHTLTLGLRYSHFETDDPDTADRDTISFDSRYALAQPTGQIYASFGADHVTNGNRFSLGGGWRRELQGGSMAVALSATRTTQDTLALTGSANISQTYAFGTLNANVRRSVNENNKNQERVVTGAGIGFSRPLTATTNLVLGADLGRSTLVASDVSTTNANFRASISHKLTEDWNLNAGYTRRWRNKEAADTGWVASDSIFLGISRSFEMRF